MMTITGGVGLLLAGALLTRILGAAGDGVHVCVGGDRVLRLERSARCAAGSTEYFLAEVNMTNDNLVTVVALTQGATGGGYLSLGDANGASAVEAGTSPEGVGLVRAMPNGNPGAGLVGMPGTFILGRK